MNQDFIISEIDDRIGRLILNRPERRNALPPEMMMAAGNNVLELSKSTNVILLSATGPVFCSGFDLRVCNEHPSVMYDMLSGLLVFIKALREVPVPVVCAVQGAAVAGGCALLSGCDYVISHKQARMGYPALKIGISPAVTAALFRLSVGDGSARERLLDTRLFSATEALNWGLIHECMDYADEVLPCAEKVAHEFKIKPPHSLQTTKEWLNKLDGSLNEEVLNGGLVTSSSLAGDNESRQRIKAIWNSNPNRNEPK